MKINKFHSLLLAALAFVAASCSDDNNTNMVPDSVYLLCNDDSRVSQVSVFDGLNSATDVVVIKAGKGFTGASVSLKVNTALLDGTGYTPLPSDCYQFESTDLSFGKSDYRKAFKIKWNRDNLKQTLSDDEYYAIPLTLVNNNPGQIELKSDMKDVILVPVIEDPLVSFSVEINQNDVFVGNMPTVGKLHDYVCYFKVVTNFVPSGKLKYSVAVDKDYVSKFNQEHGTNYQVLPDEFYSFEKLDWELPNLQKEGFCNMVIHEEKFNPAENQFLFGSYMIPIVLTSVSEGKINPSKCIIPYWLEFNPNAIAKGNWTVISASSSVKNDSSPLTAVRDQLPDYLIDGNSKTCWSSLWTKKDIAKNPLPYYIDINMDETYKIARLGITNPTGNDAKSGSLKVAHFEGSLSGKDDEWFPIGDKLTATEVGTPELTIDVPVTKTKYLRLVIEEVFDVSGVNGRILIAEINAWSV